MNNQRFPLRYSAWNESDLTALQVTLASGMLSGESDAITRYELALKDWFDVPHAVALSSGSAAIHAALTCVGVQSGDEVLVPAIAPLPSVLPILSAGGTPVVVDISADDLSFSVDDLTRKISPKTKAALAVLLWGYPQNLSASRQVLQMNGIPLIEDACQAHGTRMNGKLAGTLGTMGCFSTHDYKFLSTGEGGFVLTADADLAQNVRRFSRLGGLDGVHYGPNYKLSALAASLGEYRLSTLSDRLLRQRQRAERLLDALSSAPLSHLCAVKHGSANYYSLVMECDPVRLDVSALIKHCAHHGVVSDKIAFGYDVLYRRSMFTGLHSDCPTAETLVDNSLQLPCHPGLTFEDIDRIAEIVIEGVSACAR